MSIFNWSIVTKFVVWSLILIGLVIACGTQASWNNQKAFSDGTPDFNYWQQKYKDIAYELAPTADTKAVVQAAPIEVEQYTLQQFPFSMPDGTNQQRVDRCESCHAGVENPSMTAENIIKTVDHQTVAPADVPTYLAAHPETMKIVFTLGVHPGRGEYETLTAASLIQKIDNLSAAPDDIPGYLKAHADTANQVYAQLGFNPASKDDITTAKKIIYHNGVVQAGLPWAVVVGDTSDEIAHKRAAKDDYVVSAHPFSTYGCTTCHYGSGRELVEGKAHGDSDFWLQPMLPSKYQEAACAQCHVKYNAKTYAAVYLPEMTKIAHGQDLFKKNACWGCHKIEGYSKGNVGPELSYEGRITTYISIEHQLWDPRYKVNNCIMPYFFSKKIEQYAPDKDNPNVTIPALYDNFGDPLLNPDGSILDPAKYPRAKTQSSDTDESLDYHGYIPDATKQADVDALVTFITAQTGLNYAQDRAGRLARLTSYNAAQPDTVPVSATEGKILFQQSGCSACHYQGDPDHPKNGKGGIAGPNLSWEGARHSQQWLVAHYVNPQYFVPKSIMPVFPFSDSQRAALSLYDSSFKPKGSKAVSPDQDLPTAQQQKDLIVVPQVRYMTR